MLLYRTGRYLRYSQVEGDLFTLNLKQTFRFGLRTKTESKGLYSFEWLFTGSFYSYVIICTVPTYVIMLHAESISNLNNSTKNIKSQMGPGLDL